MSLSSRSPLLRAATLLPFALAALSQLDCSAGSSTSGSGGTGGGGQTFATSVTVKIIGVGQVDAAGKAGTKSCTMNAMGQSSGECTTQWAAGDPPTLTAKSTDPSSTFQLWADGSTGETVSTKPTLQVKEGDMLTLTALFSGMSTTTTGGCMNNPSCCPNNVCPTTVVDMLPSIAGLVEQGSDLYYFGSVEKIAKTGGMAKEVVSGTPGSFAVDEAWVYYVDASDVSLWKVDHDGKNTTKVASLDGQQYQHAMALDATNIYMTWLINKNGMDCPSVVKIPKTGGDPAIVATGCDAKPSKPYAIALSDTHVFLGTIASPKGGALLYAPKDSNEVAAVQLTAGQNTSVTRIAADGDTVYYLLNGLLVMDVKNPAGATHVDTMMTSVNSFVIDQKDVIMVGNLGVSKIDRMTQKETLLANEPGTTVTADATDVYWGSGTPGAAKILKVAR
ncbi:MAG: hypothetical protein U0359_21365 [Byssovorax sp.]